MHIGYDCERVTKSKFVAAAVYVLAPVAKYLHASVCGNCSYSFLEEWTVSSLWCDSYVFFEPQQFVPYN